MTKAEFIAKVAHIQATLNAPKGQYNSFGGYHYRSAEDILNAVKPLLNGLYLSVSDDIIQLGDRYYVKSTATITDGEHSHSASALAREALTKKGMDDAQVTGSTSSYARKYALNGLFGIDDAKDADTDAYAHQNGQQQRNTQQRGNQQRNQQQRPQGQNGAQNGQQRAQMGPDEIYTTFCSRAAKESDQTKLKTLYSRAWNALNGNEQQQSKVHQAFNHRMGQLKQAAQQTQGA